MSAASVTAEGFLSSAEATALHAQVPPAELEAVLDRFAASARASGVERAEELDGDSLHAIIGHKLREHFERGDPLAAHVGPVVRAYLAHLARAGRVKRLRDLERVLDATLPEFQEAVRTGEAGHHHAAQEPFVRATPRVGRNEPCPCGSGRKFKRCCGTP